ncbi:uncharacterized protein LOC110997531 [Pieris rapae]|uniref:uncharacterized protein LOC110997531 n=1 Tax=Pieris rapae TaxID=64459 RepID=UPI001E27FC85|nr:uncharacterized protein LOC110997531 [Pieris rapae]
MLPENSIFTNKICSTELYLEENNVYVSGSILFIEEKVWPTVRLNRVIDIYYKSSNSKYSLNKKDDLGEIKVSQVNIYLITNNTDCIAFSDLGIGLSEFKATMFHATNTRAMYYRLTIFTCD